MSFSKKDAIELISKNMSSNLAPSYWPDELKDDIDLMLKASAVCNAGIDVYNAASLRVQSDYRFVESCLKTFDHNATDDKKRQFFLQALQCCPESKILVCAAVNYDGSLIFKAPEHWQLDKSVVLLAVKTAPELFCCKQNLAYQKFYCDKDVVLEVVKARPSSYPFDIHYNFRDDKDVTLAAVSRNGLLLKYASPRLRNNSKIVEAAVRSHGEAFKFASEEIRNNKISVIRFMAISPLVFNALSDKIKQDPEIAYDALNISSQRTDSNFIELSNNEDLIMNAILYRPDAYKLASVDVMKTTRVAERALSMAGELIAFAPPDVRGNKKLVLLAMRTAPETAYMYASDNLRDDPEIKSLFDAHAAKNSYTHWRSNV